MIAGSVFCEVLHSEAIHRKHDGTHYKDVTFRRRSVLLVEKNVKQMPVPYMHQDGTFFSLPLMEKKSDLGAAALYGGKRKRTVLPSWQSE